MTALRLAVASLALAAAGVIASALPASRPLQAAVDLHWLFQLRGPREPPRDVVLVALSAEAFRRLDLDPSRPRHWPRELHARLVRRLAAAGAAAIVFDVSFEQPRDPKVDRELAAAFRAAGNVVLFQGLREEVRELRAGDGALRSLATVMRRHPLAEPLRSSGAAIAPFPLPRVPRRVDRCWLLVAAAGDAPSLPLAALAVAGRRWAGRWRELVPDAPPLRRASDARPFLDHLRARVAADPAWAAAVAERAGASGRAGRALASLLRVMAGEHAPYVDYYGPPGTIQTVPYLQALGHPRAAGAAAPDFGGKVVFIGYADPSPYGQTEDHYRTVYSRPDGSDLSGVEIAATALANLIEGRRVRPLPPASSAALLAGWGLVLGMLLFLLRPWALIPAAVVLAAAYLAAAHQAFAASGTWLPLAVPLALQLPLALLSALVWRYVQTRRERVAVAAALARFLPPEEAERLVGGLFDLRLETRRLRGVCLASDVQDYTRLAEAMDPDRLMARLKAYYAVIAAPVERHGGHVSDVVGDAMLALWRSRPGEAEARRGACLAAMEIRDALQAHNPLSPGRPLPTRIGINCGELVLGAVGTGRHVEVRPVGDAVNTASRIEALNKHLGTCALASEEVVAGLDAIGTRELGAFRLPGKRNPLVVHELIGPSGGRDAREHERDHAFAAALAAFREGRWADAAAAFEALLVRHGADGPSAFYLAQCRAFLNRAPPSGWDGVVEIDSK